MSKLKMTMTKMATLMYMMRMMTKTLVMTVTLIILMAARRTVMMMMMMMIVMMKVLRVAVTGTKATIAKKLYVKVDPNSKIKLKFMLESSRALML